MAKGRKIAVFTCFLGDIGVLVVVTFNFKQPRKVAVIAKSWFQKK